MDDSTCAGQSPQEKDRRCGGAHENCGYSSMNAPAADAIDSFASGLKYPAASAVHGERTQKQHAAGTLVYKVNGKCQGESSDAGFKERERQTPAPYALRIGEFEGNPTLRGPARAAALHKTAGPGENHADQHGNGYCVPQSPQWKRQRPCQGQTR